MTAPIRIALRTGHADVASVSLGSYLGGAFADYRNVMARIGARWDAAAKANYLPLAQLPELLKLLAEKGLGVSVAAEIKEALDHEASEATRLAEAGRARLSDVDARMASAGQRLYPFQRSGVQWLAPRRQALLADEMGLGKTVQALVALPADSCALVVAPAAVQYSWLTEIARWRPDMTASVANSGRRFRWPRPGEIIVATYGSLPPVPDEAKPAATPADGPGEALEVSAEEQAMEPGILMPPGNCTLIADEAHLLKNATTRRVKRWRQIRDSVLACDGRVWLLTGTPLLNRPNELWAVLDAAGLAKAAFGSWPRFNALFNYSEGWHATDEVPLALQRVSLHRQRTTVLPDLPRKVRQHRRVPIDKETLEWLEAIIRRLAEEGVPIEAAIEMLASNAGSGIAFELISKLRWALATAKLAGAVERVEAYEAEDTPLLVFCSHVAPLQAIGRRPGWGFIDGSVGAEDRALLVSEFQAGKLKGLALSFAAGGVGITLTHAHHVLCIDLPWTPALLQQAEDRCCRIGQTADSVHVEILSADHPIDWRVAELLVSKAELIEAAVQASAQPEDYVGRPVDEAIAEAAASAAAAVTDAPAESSNPNLGKSEPARLEIRPATPGDRFRAPANETELAAAHALIRLAELDPDRAAEANGVGFNQNDNDFGHSLAENLQRYGRLSEKQWPWALKLAARYRRQVDQMALGDPAHVSP